MPLPETSDRRDEIAGDKKQRRQIRMRLRIRYCRRLRRRRRRSSRITRGNSAVHRAQMIHRGHPVLRLTQVMSAVFPGGILSVL